MTFHGILIMVVNFAGMVFPLFCMSPNLWGMVFSIPLFTFVIWGCYKGRLSYRDDDNDLVNLDSFARPKQFYFSMWTYSVLAWCFMLAVISGKGDVLGV